MFRRLSFSCRTFLAGSLLVLAAMPVSAQIVQGSTPESPAGRAADDLSGFLRRLNDNPKDLTALIGAGEAALVLHDGNAAIGFFGRADEISPRNGAVKAGLARSLLLLENPREALRLFDDATDFGVPDVDVAGDRGFAHDLRGDARRAQRDYALALTKGENDEVTRRYALSLGISGDREPALALLNPLLYKRDQGAWRARAFVLAMTGDLPGANAIVRQVMPEKLATAMAPFLARLATLKPAEKAMAVHLGRFPTVRYATAETPGSGAVTRPPVIRTRPVPSSVSAASVARTPHQPPAVPAPTPTPPVALSGNGGPAIPAPAATPTPSPAPPAPAKVAAPKAKPKPPPKEPARYWAQVAGGANKRDLPKEWKRLTSKAPAVFKGKTAWTTPLRATNRLLTGPFKTMAEAQKFVNEIRKAGLDAFAWTSAVGQEIEKLPLP